MAPTGSSEAESQRYSVGYSAKANREKADVEKSSPRDWRRLSARIDDLARTPRPYGSEKLTGVDGYKLRVGQWRVIYVAVDRDRTVIITRISRRHEGTYRDLR